MIYTNGCVSEEFLMNASDLNLAFIVGTIVCAVPFAFIVVKIHDYIHGHDKEKKA